MNTEKRIDNLEYKIDEVIERNTRAFERLNDTLDAVNKAMQVLSNQVIENQRTTMELALNIYKLESKFETIEKKLS